MATVSSNSMNNVVQNQLTRSLEKILEDANLSGELKLSGRKLKEFPKGKYNLSDTVFADLSKNRFCELPNDVTAFHFLERLLLYHNAIRNIPESVGALQSLAYLDLSRNHLTTLPREICLLPLEVLLVSNNRLVSLPDELGRMSRLSELDASCNFLAHLPVRIGELRKLRVLNLRSNALVYLPLEVVNLKLVSLNLSCNRISMLPVEMRLMDNLIELDISHNPLTVPPANLCEKGMVHIFKYLETQYIKNGGGPFKQISMSTAQNVRISGTSSLVSTPNKSYARTLPHPNSLDSLKMKRPHVDSGYCTSDGFDKHWVEDVQVETNSDALNQYQNLSSSLSSNSSQDTITPLSGAPLASSESRSGSSTPSTISPGPSEITQPGRDIPDDRLANIQTYREYKEALRQQRQLDGHVVYRSKEHTPPTPQTPETNFQNTVMSQNTDHKFISSSPNTPLSSRRDYNPGNDFSNSLNHHQSMNQITKYMNGYTNGLNNGLNGSNNSPIINGNSMQVKKPVQKVIPSRNIISEDTVNSKTDNDDVKTSPQSPYKSFNSRNDAYIKPNSPLKQSSNILSHNNVPVGNRNGSLPKNGNRNVTWENGTSDKSDKFSFTMKREFDKQKEETELIEQLRNIIESRLKMTLPQDLGSALTDGVVLCHLANQVSPRAVATIHVPSATVPKLTMARCRRNVDNFLEACRKIGVEEALLPARELLLGLSSAQNEKSQNLSEKTEFEDRKIDKATLLIVARVFISITSAEKWVLENRQSAEKRNLNENMDYVCEQLENSKKSDFRSAQIDVVDGCVSEGNGVSTNDYQDPTEVMLKDRINPKILENDKKFTTKDDCKVSNKNNKYVVSKTSKIGQVDSTDVPKKNDMASICYRETKDTAVKDNITSNICENPEDFVIKNNTTSKIGQLADVSEKKDICQNPKDVTLKDRIKYFEKIKCDKGGKKVPMDKDKEDISAGNYISTDHKMNYDRSKLSLYLDDNLNQNLKYDSIVHNRLVTVVCLSGFILTVIILTLFPLPD